MIVDKIVSSELSQVRPMCDVCIPRARVTETRMDRVVHHNRAGAVLQVKVSTNVGSTFSGLE